MNNKINWVSLEKCDFQKLIRNRDLDTLESYLPILSQAKITKKDFDNPLLPIHFLKYTYLMQIMLLYMEYTKQYQEATINEIFQETFSLEDQIQTQESQLIKSKKKLLKLKAEVKASKHTVSQIKSQKRETAYACLYCHNKAFISIPLLDAHYQRHHIDKFDLPKPNMQETLLTVQTILLQQQINQMINTQTQQDFQMQTIQQTQFIQEQAEDSDSSVSEDHEEELDDLKVKEIKMEMEKKNLMLEQKLQALQSYLHIHQPKELLGKIAQLEYRIDNIKFIQPEIPPKPPSIPEISYNAGPLEDDISEVDDQDLYNVQEQQVAEEVVSKSESEPPKEPSIVVENQIEAEFLYEERDFHHIVKQVKEKILPISKEQKETFRGIGFETELERRMIKEIGVNMNEVYFKPQEELEEYLLKLQGKVNETPEKTKKPGLFDKFKHKEVSELKIDEIKMKKTISQPNQERTQSSRQLQIPQEQEQPQSATLQQAQQQKKGVQFQEFDDSSQMSSPGILIKEKKLYSYSQPSSQSQFMKASQLQKQEDNQQQQQQKQQQQQQQNQQQQQQQQQEQFKQLEKKLSQKKSSFEESDNIDDQNVQTIFQMKQPVQGSTLKGQSQQRNKIKQIKFGFEENSDDDQF